MTIAVATCSALGFSEDAAFINKSYIPVRVTDEDTTDAATALSNQHETEGVPTVVVVYGPGSSRAGWAATPGGARRSNS